MAGVSRGGIGGGLATYRVLDPNAPDRATDRITALVAQYVASTAAAGTPHDTGTLAAGWQVEKRRDSLYVVANRVRYARYVEHGSRGHAPVAMFARALMQARQRYGR